MNQIVTQLTQLFLHYPLKQRIIIMGVIIGFVSTSISLVMWANRTEYELLFSNLEPAAASSIVSDLRNSKIKYRLEDGGTTIYAPKESINELRLRFLQTEMSSSSIKGWELFDGETRGQTIFMQEMNKRRAQEGELMRTIKQFPEVSQVRVHLNLPESRLFEEKRKGSASVVLHLRPGAVMHKNQLNGIAALVSKSVEGINPNDVVILDQDGGVLFEGTKNDGVTGSVGNQYELQNNLELQLQNKVSELVESTVGRDHAVVKVTTEMNFDQVERTREDVDPDKVIVLSEEKYTESSRGNMDSSDLSIEKGTTNYETSRTTEKYVSNTGGIKRLSVAVLVDGRYINKDNGSGEMVKEYAPRSDKELKQIADLVKGAIGFDENRGDIITVENMQFDRTEEESNREYFSQQNKNDLYEKLIMYGLIAIGLILGFVLLKSLLKTSLTHFAPAAAETQPQLPGHHAPGVAGVGAPGHAAGLPGQKNEALPSPAEEEIVIDEDVYMKKLSPEARARLKAKDKMTEKVIQFAEQSPDSAAKLLRSWIAKANS
jgi:flagellar M-ring protein FliF